MAVVWQISVANYPAKSIVCGVILFGKPNPDTKTSSFSNFKYVVKTYFRKTFAEKDIVLNINNRNFPVKTNNSGYFYFETKDKIKNIEVKHSNGEIIPVLQKYPVIFDYTKSGLYGISDIDDTILISHTASWHKRLSTLFFTPVNQRKAIKLILESKLDGVFYVSKSESNLFYILSDFIRKNGLPQGLLFLSKYLHFRELLLSKKGVNYKTERLVKIVDNMPQSKFVLFGDDTQHDLKVYTSLSEKYPEKIEKIYIRQTKSKKKQHLDKYFNILDKINIPYNYF